jgi:hypothetical protein
LILIAIHNHLIDSWKPLALASAVLSLAIEALQFEFALLQLLTAVPRLLVDGIQLGIDAYTTEGVPAWQSKRFSLIRVNRHADFAGK